MVRVCESCMEPWRGFGPQCGECRKAKVPLEQSAQDNVERCHCCKERVYPMERYEPVEKFVIHKNCFKCDTCHMRLEPGNFMKTHGCNRFLCENHYRLEFPLTRFMGKREARTPFSRKAAADKYLNARECFGEQSDNESCASTHSCSGNKCQEPEHSGPLTPAMMIKHLNAKTASQTERKAAKVDDDEESDPEPMTVHGMLEKAKSMRAEDKVGTDAGADALSEAMSSYMVQNHDHGADKRKAAFLDSDDEDGCMF